MITRVIDDNDNVIITSATDDPSSGVIGSDTGLINNLGESGVKVGGTIDDLFAENPDVILDFTVPDASASHAKWAAEKGVPIVVGTTGLADDHITALKKAAEKTAVVWCANTSVGITVLGQLVEDAVRALGEDWDIEIVEAHHKHKVDAPSGTALALGEAAARGRGVNLDDVSERGRDGITGPRQDGAIGFSVMRGGDVAGEHSVIFYGEAERVEITHRAIDRMVFARGAVRAGVWASKAKPGLYSMKDVLG
jgi:4-hydroxy-tetrahydrodipicolinate reductase